jgi:hypothetical protein
MLFTNILGLVQALAPLVVGGIVTVTHVTQVLAVVQPETEVDDDLRKLIAEAILAKADADKAASGDDVA